MATEKELYERANPVSKTAITTLTQRAAAGYEKAAEILKRLNVDMENYKNSAVTDERVRNVGINRDFCSDFRHIPVHACTLHLPESSLSGTRPSASIQPGHLPSAFFGHPAQLSPQAVIFENSVILHLPSSMLSCFF